MILLFEEMRRVVPREIGRPFSRFSRGLPDALTRFARATADRFLRARKIPDRQP